MTEIHFSKQINYLQSTGREKSPCLDRDVARIFIFFIDGRGGGVEISFNKILKHD